MFIMLDGIDGSGKSTVIQTWKEYLANQGNTIFDLTDCWKERGEYPDFSELTKYDFIFTSEPTYVGIGKTIREELIKNGSAYPARAIAEAYSLDRLVLYTKIIIPALRDGKCVIQDRGVSTSLCYQPLMDKKITVKFLENLPGNALALKHRPDHLVLLSIDPGLAAQRLQKRTGKQDNVIFERTAFQKKIAAVFRSSTYQKLFTKRGTKIHYLPAEEKIGIMKKDSVALLSKLLRSKRSLF
jgi:dTMP kinase